MSSPSFDQDKELAEFFTDVEHLRGAFKDAVAAPVLTKRLFVIHGVGGVGKSSLLRMFRLHCKGADVPVALASGDEAKSAFDILARWTDDLKADGVAFSAFSKTFAHYREIQAKVDAQAKKAGGRAADIAGKAASKTAEAAGGAFAGAAIGSLIPGVGTAIGGALGGVLGGMGAEALTDWLRGFLKQPDIDLLLDPAKKLTSDFLNDITTATDKRRIVLLLDTFEQMTALEDWAREVAQRLNPNVLFVISGRALPNWGRAWDSWQKNAYVEELKPMTDEVMRELIQRYYATMRGGEPDPAQVEAIIRFARGLPMVVTSAVQLWVKYGVEDFQTVKAEIVANLVDRLMEGVPNTLIPALEAAASVRWFDQPILRAVTGLVDVREVYNELRRFPFVRVRVEGLALHDAVREIMDENLRTQDSERHCALHERAAVYFENLLEKTAGEEAERLRLERLYHRIRANEKTGLKILQEMAEELARYKLVNQFRALINDINAYPLINRNSQLWREYYNAGLARLERRLDDAESIYKAIGENKQSGLQLRAYALCDWGQILSRQERLQQPDGIEAAVSHLKQSLALVPLDSHLTRSYLALAYVESYRSRWEEQFTALVKAEEFYQQSGDKYGLILVFNAMKSGMARRGLWKQLFLVQEKLEDVYHHMSSSPYLESQVLGEWAWSWAMAGRLTECEQRARASSGLLRSIDDPDSLCKMLRSLGLTLGYQCRYIEAEQCFAESARIAQWLGKDYISDVGYTFRFWGTILTCQGETERANEYLVQSLIIRQQLQSDAINESWAELGRLREVLHDFDKAEDYYGLSLSQRTSSRRYVDCAALAGLVRVKHAQGDYAAIPLLLAEAEQLAQQYEYNDHLASLRLTQGYIAWEGKAPTWDNGFEAALHFYQHALIYALRYNRFLLDEVLSGRPQGTPLRPIIPQCLERDEEGRQMLTALREWWQTGVNDIGTPRPDTISPIPEGIPLLEAERIAREREPGDSLPQKSVIEQIQAALV